MTRPLGSLNRISRLLKEGMILAAESSEYAHDSEDPNAPPTLNRYLKTFCNKHPIEFGLHSQNYYLKKHTCSNNRQST
jgi:hypothetical protein